MNGCQLIRPFLGEFYSYENGLEAHSSFKDNGDIERRFYRRESGAGATRKDSGLLLVNEDIGFCFQFNFKLNFYQLIYQDKYFIHSLLLFSSFQIQISIVFSMLSIIQSNEKCYSN